jgi:hypothetical protein
MRERMLILGTLALASSFPVLLIVSGTRACSGSQAQAPAKSDDKASSDQSSQSTSDDEPRIVPKPKSKAAAKSKSKKTAKPDSKTAPKSKGKSAAKVAEPKGSLNMSPAVVCRSIDGYEQFEPLDGAAQSSEEKLLVYLRPLGFKTQRMGDSYTAHLVPDFEIRKRGEKPVLLQKKKYVEYKPTSPQPPQLIYLKSVISLKGLKPGDYDLTIILHDEIAKEAPATQVVKFRVIPPSLPDETPKPSDDAPRSNAKGVDSESEPPPGLR